jgi:hypothetical protein
MQADTGEKLADALRERREFVGKIIARLEALGEPAQPQDDTASPSIKRILADVTTFADVVKWARKNFEPSDVLLLETKFMKKLQLYPEREQDANYCRLLVLIFYLLAANQSSKVYGNFSHRAISEAFTTHLDMYHPLHLLEILCHFAAITIDVYVLKAVIAEVLAHDSLLTEAQEIALARLCFLPEGGMPLGEETLIDLCFVPEMDSDKRAAPKIGEAPKRDNLTTIQEIINNPDKGASALMQRYNLWVEDAPSGQRNKVKAPYYAPDLALCLQLRHVLTLADMRRAASSALLEKLTQLWEVLLPLHIDIGEMQDFRA